MAHYLAFVVIAADGPGPELVQQALLPYRDEQWDWYQLGGRWTGLLVDADGGLDRRRRLEARHGWPSQWPRDPATDIVPVTGELVERLEVAPHALLVAGEQWLSVEGQPPEVWGLRTLTLLMACIGRRVAVVDCHG